MSGSRISYLLLAPFPPPAVSLLVLVPTRKWLMSPSGYGLLVSCEGSEIINYLEALTIFLFLLLLIMFLA